MNRLLAVLTALVNTLRTYPAATAGLVSIGVAVAAKFGLNVTEDQLVLIVSVVAAVAAAVVHSVVTPVVKLPRSGADATVPPAAATPEAPGQPEPPVAANEVRPAL